MILKQLARACFAVFALVGTAVAQGQLGVSPDVLTAGGDATITYINPNRAGETITVEIDDGWSRTDEVQITLDDAGSGTGNWDVPLDWDVALFNAPEATEVARVIVGPNPSPGE